MCAKRFPSSATFVSLSFAILFSTVLRAGDSVGAIDTSLVTPDDFAALVIHPRRIAQSPLLANLLKDETVAAAIKKSGISPSEVEEVVALLHTDLNVDPEPMTAVVVHFTHAVDAKDILSKLPTLFGTNKPEPVREIVIGGKNCLEIGGKESVLAYVPNKSTIILSLGTGMTPQVVRESSKSNMERMLAIKGPEGPLVKRLKEAGADNDYLLAVAPKSFPNFDNIMDSAKKSAPPALIGYLDAAKTLEGATLMIDLTAPSLVRAVFDVKDADAADNLSDLADQALTIAKGGLAFAKTSIPKQMKATMAPIVKLGEQLLAGAKATKEGSQFRLDFKRPEVLDAAGPQLLAAVQKAVADARAAAQKAQQMNNMKQIALAMLNYESTYGTFPPAARIKDGKPLLSWRVALLPYLEQGELYKQFHLDEPWDSKHNLEVAKNMPSVYQSPSSPNDGRTRIMVFTGEGAPFGGDKKIRIANIRDGMSNTLLCVEAGPDKAVPWTKPDDLPFDSQKPLAALGKVSVNGILVAFFDGSVRFINPDNATLKALITPAGGEVIDLR